MKISTIPQIFRNVKRWTEILAVLSRYGLADWLSHLNIDFVKDRLLDRDGQALARHTQEKRIRLALIELGPTFIKLGQLMSTRPDLVGVPLASELELLQASTPAESFSVVEQIVSEELGQPLDEVFAEFEETPVASASIGQVHRARLLSGENVVVKVQHAHIAHKVREDLDVLAGLAQLAERIPEFAPYRPTATVAEMARTLRRELDFGREERNLVQFHNMFVDDPTVRIPRPYTDYCTSRVLTMERIDGHSLVDRELVRAAGFDLEQIARHGAELYLKMIFQHGVYHADPHPGNLVLLPGNIIGLLDFGMVGRIEERLREDIEGLLLGIVNRDVPLITSIIKRVGSVPANLNESGLANDVADFVGIYSNQSLQNFDLAGALNEMTEIIYRYQITLPPQVALLIKVLVTLEGTTKLMDANFSVMEVMRPFHRRLLMRRLSPRRQIRKLRRLYFELEQLAEIMPGRLMDILEQIQLGKFDVHLDHRGLGPSVNRLVLGMLTSALFLGSSLMLSQQVPPLLFPEQPWFGIHRLSLLGLAGCLTSILVGFRLLWAIGRSGHLDRRD